MSESTWRLEPHHVEKSASAETGESSFKLSCLFLTERGMKIFELENPESITLPLYLQFSDELLLNDASYFFKQLFPPFPPFPLHFAPQMESQLY